MATFQMFDIACSPCLYRYIASKEMRDIICAPTKSFLRAHDGFRMELVSSDVGEGGHLCELREHRTVIGLFAG